MIAVEITGKNRTINLKDGRSFQAQEAYAVLPGQKYPARIEVLPPKGQAPYEPGEYTIGPDSFYVNQYGSLALAPKLVRNAPAKAR